VVRALNEAPAQLAEPILTELADLIVNGALRRDRFLLYRLATFVLDTELRLPEHAQVCPAVRRRVGRATRQRAIATRAQTAAGTLPAAGKNSMRALSAPTS
jgi:hypothetical protein